MLHRKFIFWLWITAIQSSFLIGSDVFLSDSDTFGVPTLLLDNFQLTLSSKLLVDIFSPTSKTLKGYLGWLPKSSNFTYTSCSGKESQAGTICLKYEKGMKLIVKQESEDHCETESMTCHAVTCHTIQWFEHIGGTMDCFLLADDLWYGGGEVISQRWPLQSDSRPWHPIATGDLLHHPSGSVVENLWLSSSGFSIYIKHNTPLFMSFNESGNGKLCFTTSTKKFPYQTEVPRKPELTYSICSANSIKEAYTFALHKWIKKPSDIPHEILFQYPIWSTWAKYKSHIDENTIIKFATEINDYGFQASQFEIDDRWEDCYGNLKFDNLKFPNPAAMVNQLKNMGFLTTLWIHPFGNKNCEIYDIGKKLGFWVKNKDGNVLDVKWWNGQAAVLDVTNKKAVQWFTERLQDLKTNIGIESFKFDAGEIMWLTTEFDFHDSSVNLEPNIYSQLYAEMAATFGNRIEVRTGYNTQELPIIVRMFDKFSLWDYANGLQTLIPNALHLSILGYYFILPDMVGGNNYNSPDGVLPDRELYIRWLEVNTFLPFIQISISPWDYDEEIIAIAHKMLSLRERYNSYILNVAQQTTLTGEPIVRPVWWVEPDDAETFLIDSEFLIGDGILIAPVLIKGARQRDIYLPDGKWADIQKGITHEGSQWIYDYKAPLNFLPFFVRQS